MSTNRAAQVMPSFTPVMNAGPWSAPMVTPHPKVTLEARPSFTAMSTAQPGFPMSATDPDMIDDAGNTAEAPIIHG